MIFLIDTIIHLKRRKNWQRDTGLRFVLHPLIFGIIPIGNGFATIWYASLPMGRLPHVLMFHLRWKHIIRMQFLQKWIKTKSFLTNKPLPASQQDPFIHMRNVGNASLDGIVVAAVRAADAYIAKRFLTPFATIIGECWLPA